MPYPAGALQVSDVPDIHDVVLQIVCEPTYAETVVSLLPKFMPSSVSEVAPPAARFESGTFVTTGASKLKPLTRVPTTAEIVTAVLRFAPVP